jgi:hypothetical protein
MIEFYYKSLNYIKMATEEMGMEKQPPMVDGWNVIKDINGDIWEIQKAGEMSVGETYKKWGTEEIRRKSDIRTSIQDGMGNG